MHGMHHPCVCSSEFYVETRMNIVLASLERLCSACSGDDDHATIEQVTTWLAIPRPDLCLSSCLSRVATNGDNVTLGRLLLADSRVDPCHSDHNALHWAVRYRRPRL